MTGSSLTCYTTPALINVCVCVSENPCFTQLLYLSNESDFQGLSDPTRCTLSRSPNPCLAVHTPSPDRPGAGWGTARLPCSVLRQGHRGSPAHRSPGRPDPGVCPAPRLPRSVCQQRVTPGHWRSTGQSPVICHSSTARQSSDNKGQEQRSCVCPTWRLCSGWHGQRAGHHLSLLSQHTHAELTHASLAGVAGSRPSRSPPLPVRPGGRARKGF